MKSWKQGSKQNKSIIQSVNCTTYLKFKHWVTDTDTSAAGSKGTSYNSFGESQSKTVQITLISEPINDLHLRIWCQRDGGTKRN